MILASHCFSLAVIRAQGVSSALDITFLLRDHKDKFFIVLQLEVRSDLFNFCA